MQRGEKVTGVLTYFESDLLTRIGTGILGSEISMTQSASLTMGLNFNVLISGAQSSTKTSSVSIGALLPEQLAAALYEACPERTQNIESIRERLQLVGMDRIEPGTPIVIRDVILPRMHNEDCVTVSVADEKCARMIVQSGDFKLCALIGEGRSEIVSDLYDEPISLLGIIRYAPSTISLPGLVSDKLALRIAAIWFR